MSFEASSLTYPKHLYVRTHVGNECSVRLQDTRQFKKEVVIDSSIGTHDLIKGYQLECRVSDAYALLGLSVEIKEPTAKEYLKKCKDAMISVMVDRNDILRNKPLSKCAPLLGKDFMEMSASRVLTHFHAIDKTRKFVGVFMPNLTIIDATISGLGRTEALIRVEISLDLALYTTQA